MNHTTSTPGAAAADDEQGPRTVANPRRTRVAADGTPIRPGAETAS